MRRKNPKSDCRNGETQLLVESEELACKNMLVTREGIMNKVEEDDVKI